MNSESTPAPVASPTDILTRALLSAWAGEPLPDVESRELEEFDAALQAVIRDANPVDLQRLGLVTAKALLQYRKLGLEGQRAAALAQLAAKGGIH